MRLDAFAYAPKAPGKKNFMNDPETWEFLQQIHEIAAPLGLTLLPEIHAAYEEKIYKTLADKGYATYDFFLPGLVIDAIENRRADYLAKWAREVVDDKISTVNMLGCHDGIPLLDLKGLLPEDDIRSLIDLIVSRGGMVKIFMDRRIYIIRSMPHITVRLVSLTAKCFWPVLFRCSCRASRRYGIWTSLQAKMTMRR